MSLSLTLLTALGFLTAFGALQRVLDRMGLTDRQALAFVAAMILGTFLPDIECTPTLRLNIAGALIPAGLCVWLFLRAGTTWEKVRTVLAALLGGALVFGLGRWLPSEPEHAWFSDLWIYGLSTGAVAFAMGRSRRAAFVAGVMGVLLGDILQGVLSRLEGYESVIVLGGAGVLDASLVAGITAVALTEAVGEIRERLSRADHSGMKYHEGHFQRQEEK